MSIENMNNEHLSQDQIHEFLHAHSDEAVMPNHVHECESCFQSFTQAAELFNQLKQTANISPENNIWAKIESRHYTEQQEKKSKIKNWSFASIAASLLLIIGFQWHGLNQDRSIQNQIQVAIMQSQQLEQSLNSQQRFEQTSFAGSLDVTSEISELDEAIQQAYLDNEAPEVILALWKQRIIALKKLKKEPNTESNIEFI
jgi:hypothetical protein